MGAYPIARYLFLFLILFILIAIHPGFLVLFFLTIIILIAYRVKKRKKSQINLERIHPKDNSNQKINLDSSHTDDYTNWKVSNSYETKNPNSSEKIINSARFVPGDEPVHKKNDEQEREGEFVKRQQIKELEFLKDESDIKKNTDLLNEQILLANLKRKGRDQIPFVIGGEKEELKPLLPKSNPSNDGTKNKSLDAIHSSSEKNNNEIIKKSFNRNYWTFGNHEHVYSKKLRFEEAIKFCEKNDLGSKAKIRRVRMKFNRWDVENERDIEAIMPEYGYLLVLIEEFQNK